VFGRRPKETKPRAYYAWVTTRTAAPRVVQLGDAETIEKLVKAFVEEMSQAPLKTGRLKKLGPVKAEQAFRKACLEPLSRLLLNKDLWALAGARQRLLGSPARPLWNVPWETPLLPPTSA